MTSVKIYELRRDYLLFLYTAIHAGKIFVREDNHRSSYVIMFSHRPSLMKQSQKVVTQVSYSATLGISEYVRLLVSGIEQSPKTNLIFDHVLFSSDWISRWSINRLKSENESVIVNKY